MQRCKTRGDEKENQLEAWGKLKIRNYETWTIFSQTQFFTTADPVELFQALVESLNTLKIIERQVDEKFLKSNRFQVDAKKLELKYKCMLEIKKEEEEEKKASEEFYPITVCATVCKKEEEKYCLDFVLIEGDKEAFYQHYQQLINEKKLQLYNDASIEEKQ